MGKSTTQRARLAGFSAAYSAALGIIMAVAAYAVIGFWAGNRLVQVACALGIGVSVWKARDLAAFYGRLWRTTRSGARRRQQGVPLIAVTILFCAIVFWALINNLISPLHGASQYNSALVVAGAAAALLLLPAAWAAAAGAAKFLSSKAVLRTLLLVLFFAAFFAIQVRIGFAVRIPPGWDAQIIFDSAAGLATGSIDTIDPWYFSNFPNNLTLTLALARYFEAVLLFGASDLMFAGVVLNCVVLTLGAVLTYAVARRVVSEAAAMFTLLPSAVFLLLSPWIMVAYSDTLGLLFPILLFYLYLVQESAQSRVVKALLQVGMGITAAVGYAVKPTVIIVLLAFAAVAILGVLAGKVPKRRLMGAVAGAAIVVGGYAAGSYALATATSASDAVTFDLAENTHTFPLAHYLNMGAQARDGNFNPLYGAWNGPDVEATAAMPPDERTERNIASYLDRVEAMGVPGYLSFLSAKLIWFLGDGSFFLWGEGAAASHSFVAGDSLSQDIQSYYGYNGENHGALIGLWQTAWFVLLGLLSLPLFSAKPALFNRSATILRVALLGLFLFLLLFEARSRYLYLYLPFFIVLASLSASALASHRTGSRAASEKPSAEGPAPDKPALAGGPPAEEGTLQSAQAGTIGSAAPR